MSCSTHYHQNNSFGEFVLSLGIGHYVIVEANSCGDANDRAQAIGLYFGGGEDCPCCGHRWFSQWYEESGKERPELHGEEVLEVTKENIDGKRGYVHYLTGEVQVFFVKD